MKKLLSLVLVLALCGFASAAVTVNITDATGASEITVAPSDYVELLIWYTLDSEALGGIDWEIGAAGPGTLAQPTITATGRNPANDYVGPGFDEGMQWEIAAVSDIGASLGQGIANPVATVMFHCDDYGLVTISGIDVYTVTSTNPRLQVFPTINGMIIHQIPEPATIALLCLGGLLLRKKR